MEGSFRTLHPTNTGTHISTTITKLQYFWLGKYLFVKESLRALISGGLIGAIRYFRFINFTLHKERLLNHDDKGVINLFIPPVPSKPFSRIIRSYSDTFVLRTKPVQLHNILIATTGRCPFKCWYCSAAHMSAQDLSIKDLQKIIAILKDWGICIIGFTGGEPLLRTDTDDIIRQYADEFSFIIFTSGYGLSRSRADQLKDSGLFAIAISLDDHDETNNDRARGFSGAYEISLDAIANARRAGLYTVVQSVITKAMIEQNRVGQFLSFIKTIDPDELLLLEPLATGNLLAHDNSVFLTSKQRKLLRDLHDNTVNDHKLPKIHSFAYTEHYSRYGCGAGRQHAYIDTRGNFWPCNFLPISLGNVLKKPSAVYERNLRYFSRPCSTCILMEDRAEIQQLFTGQLPISFEKVQPYLEKRFERIKDSVMPEFYRLMGS
ncbi:hypothetical protein A2Y85_05255 [candidate division WOR-3 bacterium RBG_13_43_14]|uniref:Radical SAM core domain-containing protein n=1 Tax=candidate division WOR-3 bacterium RBG_13_43_14 TaxID=1802590 RepID=A0A1F4UA53_UNCW3|nr:MAG: hypothetical protein A2Y85_05255 [candidate division WOR-3 bacterium RBG_13_43_14]